MLYIFLDESGDLGFDFEKQSTTDFFVVTLLLVRGAANRKAIDKGTERTLKNKINVSKQKKKVQNELKGVRTSLKVKEYFYRQVRSAEFQIFTIVLNKRRVYSYLREQKAILYN